MVSSGQRLLRNILIDNDFGPVEMEYPVAKYHIDIYLTRFHVGIEYDGPVHTLHYMRDTIRQANITKEGLPILRISSAELKVAKDNPSKLVKKVTGFIAKRGKRDIEV